MQNGSEESAYWRDELFGRVNALEILVEQVVMAMVRRGVNREALLTEMRDGALAQARTEYVSKIGFSAGSRYTMRQNVEQKVDQMCANLNIRTLGVKRATGRY